METALYLFCLARRRLLPELRGNGVGDGNGLFQEKYDDITAVVCEVPLDDFVGPSAESQLEDLSWVGPRAVRHGEVVEQALTHSPVLPARFGTLFSSRASLREFLDKHYVKITQFLDYMTDKDEWAVKVFVSELQAKTNLLSERLAADSKNLDSMSPGMRYFKEKQIQAEIEKQMRSWLSLVSQTVRDQLLDLAVSAHRRKVVSGLQRENHVEAVANWAFLVNRNNVSDFAERIGSANAKYNDQGLLFETSGPWPPYSFTPTLETEAGL